MLPTASSMRPPDTVGASPYLELENHLHFKRGDYTVVIDTVLYSRRAEPDRPQRWLDRLLAPLHAARSAVRAWRAKNWVVQYVKSHFNGTEPARSFLQSVRAEGRVRRDDFLCLLLSDKVQSLSTSRLRKDEATSGASLDVTSRDAVLAGLVRQELSKEGFAVEQVRAFVDYLKLGQISEPDRDVLWQFASHFEEKFPSTTASRVMHLLKPKRDQLNQDLLKLEKLRSIRQRWDEHNAENAPAIRQPVSTAPKHGPMPASTQTSAHAQSSAKLTSATRTALTTQLQRSWTQEGGIGMAGLPLVVKRRELFLRYLHSGLSGMGGDDLYHLKQFAMAARHQTEYTLPAGLRAEAESGFGMQFDAALAELERVDHVTTVAGDALLKRALQAILASGKLPRDVRLIWSDATRPLLDFALHRRLPDDAAALTALKSLTDLGSNPLKSVRDSDILEFDEASHLYELVSTLRSTLKASAQARDGQDQVSDNA